MSAACDVVDIPKVCELYTGPPLASCICPTHGRHEFLPLLINCFRKQTYSNKELIIFDDSPTSWEYAIENKEQLEKEKIFYYYLNARFILGSKRNYINKFAKGEYIICMDDDDYQFPQRIQKSIEMLTSHKVNLANTLVGSSSTIQWFIGDDHLYRSIDSHSYVPNGFMAYHKSYLETHKYDDMRTYGEEQTFMDKDTVFLFIPPTDVIIIINHDSNTFDRSTQKKLLTVIDDTIDKYLDAETKQSYTNAKAIKYGSIVPTMSVFGDVACSSVKITSREVNVTDFTLVVDSSKSNIGGIWSNGMIVSAHSVVGKKIKSRISGPGFGIYSSKNDISLEDYTDGDVILISSGEQSGLYVVSNGTLSKMVM